LPPIIFIWKQSSHICCDGMSVTLTWLSCFDFLNLAVAWGVLSRLSPTSTCACHDSCCLHLFLSVVIVIIRWASVLPTVGSQRHPNIAFLLVANMPFPLPLALLQHSASLLSTTQLWLLRRCQPFSFPWIEKWWLCHHWREDQEHDSETLAKIFDSRQPIKFLNQIAHKIIWIELSLYPDCIPNSNQRYPDF
jgi:hypothetical protein